MKPTVRIPSVRVQVATVKFWFFCVFLFAFSACSVATTANSETATLEKEDYQPEDIKAVVLIPSPKVGNLFQLRGIAGKGKLIARQKGETSCVSASIRLAAGDFGGDNISIHDIDSIRLEIYADEIVERLLSSDEVVSDQYQISGAGEDVLGDIKIESGLSLSYGFVLNPGEWSWSSIFGIRKKEVDCDELKASEL